MKTFNLLRNESSTLDSKEMLSIQGGKTCGCACYYRNAGGSSVADNRDANYAGGLHSPQYPVDIKTDIPDATEIF